MKRVLKKLTAISVFLLIITLICNKVVINNALDRLYSTTANIPKNKVGLVLGTSKYLIDGRINLYYKFRLDAAVELYQAKKIDFIVVSGDNGSKSYDEPTTFKEDLIKAGVPEHRIYLDYAGFRTLDSIVRIKEIFKQSSITIISQKFHNERALYLADNYNIEAVGFNARGISGGYAFKVTIREYLARVKLFIDILFNTQPKFLGKPVVIP